MCECWVKNRFTVYILISTFVSNWPANLTQFWISTTYLWAVFKNLTHCNPNEQKPMGIDTNLNFFLNYLYIVLPLLTHMELAWFVMLLLYIFGIKSWVFQNNQSLSIRKLSDHKPCYVFVFLRLSNEKIVLRVYSESLASAFVLIESEFLKPLRCSHPNTHFVCFRRQTMDEY